MPKYRVSINFYQVEVEADDFGYAFEKAEERFDFFSEAEVEEICEENELDTESN